MNAELVVQAIVGIGKANRTELPKALQQLADSLNYKHAAIVTAERSGKSWVPVKILCQSREFRRASRSVLSYICESKEPVRVLAIAEAADMTQSVLETDTFAAAGIKLEEMSTAERKTVLMMVSDDKTATLGEIEKHLLSSVGTLVAKGLSGQELELPEPPTSLPGVEHLMPKEPENPKLGDAIGIVSHDLRNPVGTILGYTELLLSGKKGDELEADQKRAITKIRDNSMFILHLLGNLLDSAQLDNGKARIDLKAWDVDALIEQSVDRCRMAAEKKNIKLVTAIEKPGLRAQIDHVKLGQVLDNLITNAVKFTLPGKSVTVGARAAGAQVELYVQDEGQGIPAAEVPNLFRKFSRTTTRATAGEKSTGLGLYIVSELVKLHGGSVRVDTALDRGSTFTITLQAA